MNKQEIIDLIDSEIFSGETTAEEGLGMHRALILVRENLDEPETLSPEWIEDMEFQHPDLTEPFVKSRFLKNLLIPNQSNSTSLEKPVVPQFVADWIEKTKAFDELEHDLFNLITTAFAKRENGNKEEWTPIERFMYENHSSITTIIDAYRYGYEIEKEKLWVVKTVVGYLQKLEMSRKDSGGTAFYIQSKSDAIHFSKKEKVNTVAMLISGEVEEVEEC